MYLSDGGYWQWGRLGMREGRGIWEISMPSCRFCHELKTALKNKVLRNMAEVFIKGTSPMKVFTPLRRAHCTPYRSVLYSAASPVSSIKSCCLCCSVAQSCSTLCDPMDCSTQASLSFTISWSLLKLMSTESVMPSNHLQSSLSPPAFNLSQHWGLFQWVSSLHQVATGLEL